MKKFMILILMLSLFLLSPYTARAEGTLGNVGYGAGAVLTSCLYSPAKLVYALTGAITGGMAYVITGANQGVASKIWTPSLRGTYVITPAMLKGQEEIQFVGRPEEAQK